LVKPNSFKEEVVNNDGKSYIIWVKEKAEDTEIPID